MGNGVSLVFKIKEPKVETTYDGNKVWFKMIMPKNKFHSIRLKRNKK